MRTRKALSAAAAALALVTAAGCCGTNYDCPPAVPAQAVVVAAPAPAPVVVASPVPVETRIAVAAASPANRQGRWHLRRSCNQPAVHPVNHCCLCGPVAAYAVTAPAVAAAPAAVQAQPRVLVVQPAKKDAAGRAVTVLQRGRKGRILCREGNVVLVGPAAAAAAPVVVTASAPVVSEPVFVEPVVAAEPVAAVPAEPVVEEPSWAKYLAPEQPAAVAVASAAPSAAEPTAQFIESAPAEPFTVAAPAPVYAGRQPIIIQPIIQPVVQAGQEVLSGQVQAPAVAPMAFTTQPLVTFQPAPYAQVPQAGVPPVMTGSMFTTNPLVCGPGQNCFTLSENQLRGGPQILTPTAAAPLMPAVTVASATGANIPAAPLAVPPAAAQDKYAPAAAPVAAAPAPALPAQRPEVSMPAPLGQTTTPSVAGTDEIENALDVMMGNTPVLK